MNDAPLNHAPLSDEEELARAEIYGLLARLWTAPPDQALLTQLRSAQPLPDAEAPLAAPWQGLLDAMRATTLEAASEEYDALFQGVGKPEVFLYGSFYLSGFLNERPLVKLRHDLRELGLARAETQTETEDHVSFLFEVMRYLIAGDDVAVCNLERQRRFFRAHLQTWVDQLCDAVEAHPIARDWRTVAGLTRSFMKVETQAFDMLET